MRHGILGAALILPVGVALVLSCSASNETSGFTGGAGGTGEESSAGGGLAVGTGGFGIGGNTGCKNLECQIPDCGGGTTSLSGKVVTPTPPQYGPPDPIYNAVVYVPNADVQPFPPGVACDKCGAPASGDPIVVTLTDSKGQFVLKDVPAGKNIPLVIQVGRWRRQVVVPEITACADNPLPTDLTRLARNKAEGDIPHIAIASSPYDAEECILRKIGVDDAEFTASTGDGRIHIYQGGGSGIPGTEPMETLWGDLARLKQYDMTLFPCSSVPYAEPQAFQNVFDYADAGGRVFATDLSYPWFQAGPAPWPATSQWVAWGGVPVDPLPSLVDQTFPKGKALAEWLQNIGATPVLGQIDLFETYHVVDAVNAPTTRWLYSQSPATVQTLSFNTPVGAKAEDQCGRAVYSNFHIAYGGASGNYPTECDNTPLTPQERVMEFLLFDLSSCLQKDDDDPIPPPF